MKIFSRIAIVTTLFFGLNSLSIASCAGGGMFSQTLNTNNSQCTTDSKGVMSCNSKVALNGSTANMPGSIGSTGCTTIFSLYCPANFKAAYVNFTTDASSQSTVSFVSAQVTNGVMMASLQNSAGVAAPATLSFTCTPVQTPSGSTGEPSGTPSTPTVSKNDQIESAAKQTIANKISAAKKLNGNLLINQSKQSYVQGAYIMMPYKLQCFKKISKNKIKVTKNISVNMKVNISTGVVTNMNNNPNIIQWIRANCP